MQPSRIVKSAHRRAGRPLPLKQFARQLADKQGRLGAAARMWLDLKQGQPVNVPPTTRGSWTWPLKRNTITLAAFPAKKGSEISFEKLYSRTDFDARTLNNALADLLKLGYVEQTDEGYARTRDSLSRAARVRD